MNKLMIALIAAGFASAAAAQTGTVDPGTIADHGTPAYHAKQTQQAVEAGKAVKGLVSDDARLVAVKEATRIADHGTPVIHANEASLNFEGSKNTAKPVSSYAAGQVIMSGLAKLSTR